MATGDALVCDSDSDSDSDCDCDCDCIRRMIGAAPWFTPTNQSFSIFENR